MKIFISSIIGGLESSRAAAREAVLQLGHEPIMAEDFGARPASPQVACLQGVREAGVVVLLLGERYGEMQASGLSPTHEEYREAKGQRPIIAFVQSGTQPDSDQVAFIAEVQAWDTGLFRGEFATPEQLRMRLTQALHQWELANATGPLDPAELLERALGLLPNNSGRSHYGNAALLVAIASGPSQTIIRPSEMEKEAFADDLAAASFCLAHASVQSNYWH